MRAELAYLFFSTNVDAGWGSSVIRLAAVDAFRLVNVHADVTYEPAHFVQRSPFMHLALM